jgi:hypothetical protein
MATKAAVTDFAAQRVLAVVGVSRSPNKFGTAAFRELKARGYRVLPVNRNVDSVEGERCYPSLKELPEPVDGVVVVVPPAEAETVVRDAAEAGIRRVWLQNGAESEAAVRYGEEHGLSVISGECILMFADSPGLGHRLHRWFRGVTGKLPK